MGTFRKRSDWYQELLDKQKKPEQDDFTARKRASLLRTYEEPVLPKLARILFISMPVLPLATVLVDVSADLRDGVGGAAHLMLCASATGLTVWAVYTALIVLTSLLGIRSNISGFYKRRQDGGDSAFGEDIQRDRRAIRRLNAPYRRYIIICLSGTAAWLIFYAAAHLTVA